MRINARVRSGRVAANTMAAGPPSLTPKSDRSFEADGVHDGLDLGRPIIERANLRDGSDSPTPALSNRTTRQNVDSRSKNATNSGTVQNSSMWLTNDPAKTSSTGPSRTPDTPG